MTTFHFHYGAYSGSAKLIPNRASIDLLVGLQLKKRSFCWNYFQSELPTAGSAFSDQQSKSLNRDYYVSCGAMNKFNSSLSNSILIDLFSSMMEGVSKFLSFLFDRNPSVHRSRRKHKLSRLQKEILLREVDFYQKLNPTHQAFFEHRLSTFIRTYTFIGRDGYTVNAETKVLLGASYTMLTFGKRKFITDVFDKIIIYPDVFLSAATKKMHKGEFNPLLRTVVFSWKHFLEGNRIKNDNLNLGIHEFTHIVHIKSMKRQDASSVVFKKEYKNLIDYLQNNKKVRDKIITSQYFRRYALENQYEFVAVLVESFIETPEQFKAQFPRIYKKIKRMLNFNFLHY